MTMAVPPNWRELAFPEEGQIYYSIFPDHSLQGAFSFREVLLQGACGAWAENGQMIGLGGYQGGRRHGRIYLWNADATRLLFAQYTRDRADGFKCLFIENRPWLIQHWQNGELLIERPIVPSAANTWTALAKTISANRGSMNGTRPMQNCRDRGGACRW
jgi:hypothetical protein